MSFTLHYLNQLTHDQIDTAIEYLCKKLELPLHTPKAFEHSPYMRLFDLINPLGKSANQLAFDLKVLAKLSGGQDYELEWLTTQSRLVVATRIFLKFKIDGNYNTGLHDALTCAWRTEELTRLLIQHGANPTQTNDQNITAAVLYMKRVLPEASKTFTWEYSSPKTSLKRKLLKFVAWTMDNYPASAITSLNGLALYFPTHLYPTLLDFRPKIINDSTMLHNAVKRNSPDLVRRMLELNANPNLLMDGETKPLRLAVSSLGGMGANTTQDCLKIITLLLAYELKRSLPQNTVLPSKQLVHALLNLDISAMVHKRQIARMIYEMDLFKPYPLSFDELTTKINNESYILNRKHITFNYSFKIGEGAFANVYKGFAIYEPVAIKLGKRISNQHKMREEANLLRQLNHPNIIRFICTIERGSFGYVMPYASGGCLDSFIHKQTKPLSERCLYSFSKQINEALRYLHDRGFVHLDLKPANILLDNAHNPETPRLLLTDFGAAARIGQSRPYLVTTGAFCSPESFSFKPHPYAITHDTYSFGLCLGYLDTRMHPWIELGYDLNDCSLLAKHVRAGKRTVFNKKPMSLKIAPLVKWCWEQEPSKRPSHDNIDDYLDLILNPLGAS